jgi:hypothetical protein
MVKKPRIFIGLRELSGYYHHLKRGFDQLGIESVFVNLSGHPYRYGTDKNPKIVRIINKIAQTMGEQFFSNLAMRLLWLGFFQNILGIFLFFWALGRFDVFIFASNSTFFYFLDLPILRLLKKKIIFVFHGSESRPVYLNGYVISDTKTKTILTGIILARVQKIIISVIDRFADYSINIPPQAHFHARSFVSWLCIGVPHDIVTRETYSDYTLNNNSSEKTVRILHAPSKPEPKGTDVIRRIIQSLKNKGFRIDYVEIMGKPNAEVLKELQRCDFVIDEIYSDTPMAVFATEAAFAGKPAVVGSYYADEIKKDLASESVPPSAFCHPDRIEETVENMIRDAEWRTSLGKRAQEFVFTHWTAIKVAEHYLMLIAGDFPKEWLYDPKNIHYIHGCGLPEEKARAIVKRFIEIGGKSSLCVSDKPDLEEQLIKFALCREKS